MHSNKGSDWIRLVFVHPFSVHSANFISDDNVQVSSYTLMMELAHLTGLRYSRPADGHNPVLFCDLFALLSTLTYLEVYGSNRMISPGYHLDISDKNVIIS